MAGGARVPILLPMTSPGPTMVTRRSRDGQVLGAMLVLGGVFWLLQRSGVLTLSWQAVLSILLTVLGVGLVMTARSRGGSGLILVGVVMTLVLVSTSSIDVGVIQDGVGEHTARPLTVADAKETTGLGVGSMEIDLRDLELPSGDTTELKYTMGVGELHLVLPGVAEDVAVRVVTKVRAGQAEVLGREENGSNLNLVVEDRGYDDATTRLDIEITMGLGNVQVARAITL